jgi:MurNAc alpha-1-phosphate uridylyltransferase
MYCFIPAAGFGKRMGNLTRDLPKPLLRIGDKTLLHNTFNLLKSWGLNKFVINTHYKADLIHKEIEKVRDLDIIISYEENKILGTAGGIKKAFSNVLQNDEYFLCINPDIIYETNLNIYEIIKDFKGKCLLYLFENKDNSSYTNLNFRNKKVYFENGNYMFIGLSIMQFSIFKDIGINEYYDLADIFKKLSVNGELEGEIFPGKIIDLGEEDKYLKYTENL